MSYPVQMHEFQDVLNTQIKLHVFTKKTVLFMMEYILNSRNLEICMMKWNVSNKSFSSLKRVCMHSRCHLCESLFRGELFNWPPFDCL